MHARTATHWRSRVRRGRHGRPTLAVHAFRQVFHFSPRPGKKRRPPKCHDSRSGKVALDLPVFAAGSPHLQGPPAGGCALRSDRRPAELRASGADQPQARPGPWSLRNRARGQEKQNTGKMSRRTRQDWLLRVRVPAAAAGHGRRQLAAGLQAPGWGHAALCGRRQRQCVSLSTRRRGPGSEGQI